MAECHRYPLRVQQSKLDGWWFIFVDEVPGLGVLGPNYEDLLHRLKVVAGNVFRARGETVTDIKTISGRDTGVTCVALNAGTDIRRRGTLISLQSLRRAPLA